MSEQAPPSGAPPAAGRLILVGGGVRSGKSAFAHRLALGLGERRLFVATAKAEDDEMRARIEAHRRERGDDFHNHEAPRAVPEAIRGASGFDVVLVDCLTLWLSNEMWEGAPVPAAKVEARLAALVEACRMRPGHVVLVTNEVGMGVVPEHASARAFRDHAGRLHQQLAREADEVYLASMGCVLQLRPELRLAHPGPDGTAPA